MSTPTERINALEALLDQGRLPREFVVLNVMIGGDITVVSLRTPSAIASFAGTEGYYKRFGENESFTVEADMFDAAMRFLRGAIAMFRDGGMPTLVKQIAGCEALSRDKNNKTRLSALMSFRASRFVAQVAANKEPEPFVEGYATLEAVPAVAAELLKRQHAKVVAEVKLENVIAKKASDYKAKKNAFDKRMRDARAAARAAHKAVRAGVDFSPEGKRRKAEAEAEAERKAKDAAAAAEREAKDAPRREAEAREKVRLEKEARLARHNAKVAERAAGRRRGREDEDAAGGGGARQRRE